MRLVHIPFFIGCFVLTGCSIHPQTEDFSRSAVPDIVTAIKCEAQQAILAEITADNKYLMKSGLGLAFYFEMAEDNNKTALGSFTFPITQGLFRLGYSAGIQKERRAVQRLSTIDTFEDILSVECKGKIRESNIIYPISGSIGLDATFKNYVRVMAQHIDASQVDEFNEEVQFTTNFGGTLTPSIDLRPVSGRFVDARVNLEEGRVDIHRVKLSFTPPRTEFQNAMDLAKAQRTRAREIARLKEERKIPQKVQIVDANEKVITPFADDGQPRVDPRADQDAIEPRSRQRRSDPVQTVSPEESTADIRRRTKQDLERSERKAFEEQFTREFQR